MLNTSKQKLLVIISLYSFPNASQHTYGSMYTEKKCGNVLSLNLHAKVFISSLELLVCNSNVCFSSISSSKCKAPVNITHCVGESFQPGPSIYTCSYGDLFMVHVCVLH